MIETKKSKFGLILKIVDGKMQSSLKYEDCNINDLALAISTLEIMKAEIVTAFSKLTRK